MNRTHGYGSIKDRHRVFEIWQGMLTRCSNPNRPSWKDYGGRGIKVCDRWKGRDGFSHFLADMGEPPAKHSIDRIDCDGDYTPENCRWIPWSHQSKNRKYNWRVSLNGEVMTAADAARKIGIDPDLVNQKLRYRGHDKSEIVPVEELMLNRRYKVNRGPR